MSKDPFQDLFDREMPRSASPASTRATLDSLTPRFHRAKSRRRARVSAIAAFAVLGTTGGAAALGIGPVALNQRPRPDVNGVAGGNEVVVDPPEVTNSTTTTLTTTTVTTTVPTTIPAVTVTTNTAPEPTDSIEPPGDNITAGEDQSNGSDRTAESDQTGQSGQPDQPGGTASESGDQSGSPDTTIPDTGSASGSEDTSSVPVAGPLTKTIDEGSVTVKIGPDGLILVDVTPADDGINYEIDAGKADEINVQFRDATTGDELSSLDFKLVDGGISVTVDTPSH